MGLGHTGSSRIYGAYIPSFFIRNLMSTLLLTDDLHLVYVHETTWAVTSYRRYRRPPGLSSLVFNIQSVDIRSRGLLPVAPP